MSTLKISEAGTVQFPMVKHAVEIGWTPITPEDARVKRGGEVDAFFRDVLESKLSAFNLWMSADVVRSVVETLDALPASIEGCIPVLASANWKPGKAWIRLPSSSIRLTPSGMSAANFLCSDVS